MPSPAIQNLVEIVRTRGLTHFEVAVKLASGEYSHEFIDGKKALARGADLRLACEAMIAGLEERGIAYDAVGGLTMGADQFAHGIALITGCEWFVVRKEPKNRGTNKLVEGAKIDATTRVVLIDDVVTTGGSIQKAHDAIVEIGAQVVAAVTLVDRGEVAAAYFTERSIPYLSIVTYRDLGIEPVGPVASA